jgi:hypothetical protein
MRSCLHPKYLRRSIAADRLIEESASDLRIRVSHPGIKLIAKVLPHRLRVTAADDRGNILLPDAASRQRSHLLAHCISDDKCSSRHFQLLIDRRPSLGRVGRD